MGIPETSPSPEHLNANRHTFIPHNTKLGCHLIISHPLEPITHSLPFSLRSYNTSVPRTRPGDNNAP